MLSFYSLIVSLHHLDYNEMPGEKARYELHTDTACCFEQILLSAPYKKAVIYPLTSHLTNHLNKTNKIYGILLEKSGQTHKRKFPIDTWTHQCWSTSKNFNHLCAIINAIQLPKAATDRDG